MILNSAPPFNAGTSALLVGGIHQWPAQFVPGEKSTLSLVYVGYEIHNGSLVFVVDIYTTFAAS